VEITGEFDQGQKA